MVIKRKTAGPTTADWPDWVFEGAYAHARRRVAADDDVPDADRGVSLMHHRAHEHRKRVNEFRLSLGLSWREFMQLKHADPRFMPPGRRRSR